MLKVKFKALALGVAIACASQVANANIQSQMDKMFEGMSNSTDAGAYETATRGVITGGSMRLRNKIVNAPVVAFRPPSFQAGCGGIDMFAGSFSFINAQQFVQSLRSIASNAVGVASGYAFKLALQAMGPTVANVIKDLQEAMQHLNGLMSNSCQLATGLVTDTFMAFGAKLDAADKQKSLPRASRITSAPGSIPKASRPAKKLSRTAMPRCARTRATLSGATCAEVTPKMLSSTVR